MKHFRNQKWHKLFLKFLRVPFVDLKPQVHILKIYETTISFPEPAILGKEREALGYSVAGSQESWLRQNCAFHINSQSDSSLKRIIPEPHVPSRASQARETRLTKQYKLSFASGFAFAPGSDSDARVRGATHETAQQTKAHGDEAAF
jgi:hypothetical protein